MVEMVNRYLPNGTELQQETAKEILMSGKIPIKGK
jgi:hypothetical protein